MDRLVEALKFTVGLLGLFAAAYLAAGAALLATWSYEAAMAAMAAVLIGGLTGYFAYEAVQWVFERRLLKKLDKNSSNETF